MKVRNLHSTPLAVSTRRIHKMGETFEMPSEGMPGYEIYKAWMNKGWIAPVDATLEEVPTPVVSVVDSAPEEVTAVEVEAEVTVAVAEPEASDAEVPTDTEEAPAKKRGRKPAAE